MPETATEKWSPLSSYSETKVLETVVLAPPFYTLPLHVNCFKLPSTQARIRAPSTLIRFQTKTELFCSGYGYRSHYNAENDHRKRSHSRMLSRVERFENDAFLKRCFLVWKVKTMLSENGDVIHMDPTGRQPTGP